MVRMKTVGILEIMKISVVSDIMNIVKKSIHEAGGSMHFRDWNLIM